MEKRCRFVGLTIDNGTDDLVDLSNQGTRSGLASALESGIDQRGGLVEGTWEDSS